MKYIFGLLIPFIGTSLGSSLVFFIKNKLSKKVECFLLCFSSGIMIAASVWSLIIPSIELSNSLGIFSFVPAFIGIILGFVFLIVLDLLVNKISFIDNESSFYKLLKMIFVVTIHNIPEGMAVGVCFASLLFGSSSVTYLSCLILSIGIGIQNIPEGAIISIPLRVSGKSRLFCFGIGVLSGIVEPISSVFTILFVNYVSFLLPYFLSFAAGCMIFVVIEELIPDAFIYKIKYLGSISFGFGFLIMMILDVIFS